VWVTADGVAHTVALPEPLQVLSAWARTTLAVLRAEVPRSAVEDVLEQAQDAVLDGGLQPDADDGYVGCAPPVGVLDADISTVDRFEAAILAVDARWRLDVVLALDDVITAPRDD